MDDSKAVAAARQLVLAPDTALFSVYGGSWTTGMPYLRGSTALAMLPAAGSASAAAGSVGRETVAGSIAGAAVTGANPLLLLAGAGTAAALVFPPVALPLLGCAAAAVGAELLLARTGAAAFAGASCMASADVGAAVRRTACVFGCGTWRTCRTVLVKELADLALLFIPWLAGKGQGNLASACGTHCQQLLLR